MQLSKGCVQQREGSVAAALLLCVPVSGMLAALRRSSAAWQEFSLREAGLGWREGCMQQCGGCMRAACSCVRVAMLLCFRGVLLQCCVEAVQRWRGGCVAAALRLRGNCVGAM